MIVANIEPSKVFKIEVGGFIFDDVPLLEEMTPFKKFGGVNGWIILCDIRKTELLEAFNALLHIKGERQGMAVIMATGKFAKAAHQAKTTLEKLRELVNIQRLDGNWNYDPYMHGLANGLILAEHTVSGKDGCPRYKDAPEQWLSVKEPASDEPDLLVTSCGNIS